MNTPITRNCSHFHNFDNISDNNINEIISEVSKGERTANDAAIILGVSKRQINRKRKQYEENIPLRSHPGRPPALDDTGKDNVINFIDAKTHMQQALSAKELKDVYLDQKRETLIRQGKTPLNVTISRETIRQYNDGLSVLSCKGQRTTSA
jgi:hypothetical protein